MNRFEKFLVLGPIAYTAVYIPCFFYVVSSSPSDPTAFNRILPFHFAGMILNLMAFAVTLRDLYKRPFESENTKLTWGLLIVMTGGIGWLVYVFKHGLKPRDQ